MDHRKYRCKKEHIGWQLNDFSFCIKIKVLEDFKKILALSCTMVWRWNFRANLHLKLTVTRIIVSNFCLGSAEEKAHMYLNMGNI